MFPKEDNSTAVKTTMRELFLVFPKGSKFKDAKIMWVSIESRGAAGSTILPLALRADVYVRRNHLASS